MRKRNKNIFALGGNLTLGLVSGLSSLASLGINNLRIPEMYNPMAFAGSNEELISMYNKGATQMDQIDVGASALSGAGSGAMAGAPFGLVGAGIGGLIGGGVGLATSLFGNKNITNKNNQMNREFQMNMDASRQGIENRNFNRQMANSFGFGGEMMQPSEFTNGTTEFNAGGVHELNPNGGIPLGMGANGQPNLVEEGEFKFKDYVFSNRIAFDKKKSFADKAKEISKESKERPNDTISQNGLKALLDKLKNLLDLLKLGAELGLQLLGNSFAGGTPPGGLEFERNTLTPLGINASQRFDELGLPTNSPASLIPNIQPLFAGMQKAADAFSQSNSIKSPSTASAMDLRYAPAIASGLASVTDALGLTNKPDYTLARLLGNMKVTPKNIGNYQEYNPFDKNFYTNQVLAGAAGTRSGLRESSGGNRAAYLASLLGADYGANLNVANMAVLSEQENTNRRNNVNAFNNRIDEYNSSLNMLAQELNNRYRSQGAMAAADEVNQSKGARMNNLNNFLQSLGDIGTEEAMKRLINSNPALYYELTSGLTLKKKR